MIQTLIQAIGTSIVSHEDGSLLGIVKDMIFNPDTGKVEALWTKTVDPSIMNPILLMDSVIEWKKNIYIKDEREFAEADDVIRITEILDRNAFYLGNAVVDENQKILGCITDFYFDTEIMYIKSIVSEKFILGIFRYGARVFSYESIIRALPECVIVKNTDEIKVPVKDAITEKSQPVMDV